MDFNITQQVFNLLRAHALDRETVTYREIGETLGINPQSEVHPHLRVIWDWCEDQRLPHLNALVVRQDSYLPGIGYAPDGHPVTWAEHQMITQRVFDYLWESVSFAGT